MNDFDCGPVRDDAELAALGRILPAAFAFDPASFERWAAQVGRDRMRCVREGGRVVGGLAVYPGGLWLGGRAVPLGGIAAVGVAAERRGGGAAFALLRDALGELRGSGVALSALYASTMPVYRKLGYEAAGTRAVHAIDADRIQLAEERALPVEELDAQRPELLEPIYRQHAARTNGHLERSAIFWHRLARSRGEAVRAYAIPGEGYVVTSNAQPGRTHDLELRELVALTPRALARLWTLVRAHRSYVEKVRWFGPAHDPRLLPLRDHHYEVEHVERWMLRLVDVAAALAARGYPGGVEAELHLEVTDEVLPWNAGRFTLRVAGGRGEVVAGGRGELRAPAGALAPLYTGLFSLEQLAGAGRLEATPAAASAAAQIFAGPEPWMPDMF